MTSVLLDPIMKYPEFRTDYLEKKILMKTDSKSQEEILYEIVMSIGHSLELEDMLNQSVPVFLNKLECTAAGAFFYVKPGKLQPKLRRFLIPRVFSGTPEYSEISESANSLMSRRILSDDQALFPPVRIRHKSGSTVILEIPEIGFFFLSRDGGEFSEKLITALQQPLTHLSQACISCYQNDALIQSQYDLELRIAHRTKELEKRNNELKQAYEKLQNAQRQLIHSEKMASVGQLAAGVAHEINNPTGYIASNLETMTEYIDTIDAFFNLSNQLASDGNSLPKKELISKIIELKKEADLDFIMNDSKALLEESIAGAHRIRDIVSGLKNFVRDEDSHFKKADVNSAIEEALRFTWNELKYKSKIEKKLGELPEIYCKKEQLIQVFVNILVNASQAINEHGRIMIESYEQEEQIIIKFSDTGHGIPEEHLSKLFDPFFTTKEIGEGTGLGLSISHGIIEKHGGSIGVESSPDEGTCFTIILPVQRSAKLLNTPPASSDL